MLNSEVNLAQRGGTRALFPRTQKPFLAEIFPLCMRPNYVRIFELSIPEIEYDVSQIISFFLNLSLSLSLFLFVLILITLFFYLLFFISCCPCFVLYLFVCLYICFKTVFFLTIFCFIWSKSNSFRTLFLALVCPPPNKYPLDVPQRRSILESLAKNTSTVMCIMCIMCTTKQCKHAHTLSLSHTHALISSTQSW